MDSPRISRRSAVMTLHAIAMVICALSFFSGRYPPAHAQELTPLVPNITAEDQRQDDSLRQIVKDQDASKNSQQRQWDAINALRQDVATLKGQQGNWTVQSGSIGSLLLASLGFQAAPYLRRRKRALGS